MSKKISEYTFSHGLHRGANGSYIQLSKELLGRALTHEEMNYNLALTGEIIKNYEILINLELFPAIRCNPFFASYPAI